MNLWTAGIQILHGWLGITGVAIVWMAFLLHRQARYYPEKFGSLLFASAGVLALIINSFALSVQNGRGPTWLAIGYGLFSLSTALAILFYLNATPKRSSRPLLEQDASSPQRVTASERTDGTTGLSSHQAFQEELEQEIIRSRRYNRSLSLLMVDIDHFKTLNDSYGYEAGDAILKELSRIIHKELRTVDRAARYGGEEFSIILPETPLDAARMVADRLRNSVLYHVFPLPKGHRAFISISIGVANFPVDARDKDGLIQVVHRALFFAKQNGRNRIGLHSEELLSGYEKKSNGFEGHGADSKLGVMRTIGVAIDSKTPFTQGHTDQVVRLAMRFSKVLELNPEEAESLRVASLLHNIGLINAPESILNKPGPLTLEERKIIQAHPTLAEMLLKDAPQLDGVLPAILYHHERWDGNGYPKGLRKNEIPYLARVLAIAESYQAMVSERPYRRKMSEEEAIEELRRSAGSQFDPEIVNRLLGVLANDA